MYVIKFGGTSVASAKNISLVRDIVEQKAQQDNLIVVVSALSGITNKLVKLGEQAVRNNPDNPALLAAIEQAHVDACNALIDEDHRSLVMGYISQEIQRLKEIVQGVGLVGELTPKMQDKIVSTGERLSSFIISTYFNQQFPTELLDPAEFIITDDNHGSANVNYPTTMEAIGDKPSAITGVAVCPGFVAQSVSQFPD